MGTTVYRATRAQAVQDELRDISVRSLVLAHCVKGARLWVLAQVKGGPQAGTRWIALSLIHTQGQDVAVKRLDESCGPYYYDCPLLYLEMARPPDGPHAGPWREKVRAHHAQAAERRRLRRQAQPGLRVLYGQATYALERPLGRRGWVVTRECDGLSMRMNVRQFAQATRLAPESVASTAATSAPPTTPTTPTTTPHSSEEP